MTLEQKPIETQSGSISDKLASLDAEFNPNKEFGMMGVLRAQDEAQRPAIESQAAPVIDPETKADEPPDWAQALESSFRATRNDIDQKLQTIESRFAQPITQMAQDLGDDVDPIVARQNQLEAQMSQTRLNTAWERANTALVRAKQKFGDTFDYNEAELQATWRQQVGNNLGVAEGTNWDTYFQQQFDSRQRPRLEAEVAKLRAEAQGKTSSVVSNMGAVPRGGRNGAPQIARTNDDGFNEDLYQRASKRMGKHGFRGFNNILSEEQTRQALRTG